MTSLPECSHGHPTAEGVHPAHVKALVDKDMRTIAHYSEAWDHEFAASHVEGNLVVLRLLGLMAAMWSSVAIFAYVGLTLLCNTYMCKTDKNPFVLYAEEGYMAIYPTLIFIGVGLLMFTSLSIDTFKVRFHGVVCLHPYFLPCLIPLPSLATQLSSFFVLSYFLSVLHREEFGCQPTIP